MFSQSGKYFKNQEIKLFLYSQTSFIKFLSSSFSQLKLFNAERLSSQVVNLVFFQKKIFEMAVEDKFLTLLILQDCSKGQ